MRNKVYDVTKYITQHPGGVAIMKNPGQDNTIGFEGDQHPETVKDLIENYYVGDLVD